VAEGQALGDAVFVRGINLGCSAKIAAAFRNLGLRQMAPPRAGAHNFPASRDLKPLGHGLFRLNTFWASHKLSFSKKSAQYMKRTGPAQAIILTFARV
jgi:hypothetical protein